MKLLLSTIKESQVVVKERSDAKATTVNDCDAPIRYHTLATGFNPMFCKHEVEWVKADSAGTKSLKKR